jgi:hypothetical protein
MVLHRPTECAVLIGKVAIDETRDASKSLHVSFKEIVPKVAAVEIQPGNDTGLQNSRPENFS